ncbi:hypothetical protein M9Y10_014086 [Tritrichomonas musculus]|uniref:Uncharacterized protein n=1 Tax=Tritrichomonas musculus TaxID=1915356 RepID=A0ABR2KZP8_9EUKA
MTQSAPPSPDVSLPGIDLSSFSVNGSSALDDYLKKKIYPSIEMRREVFQEITRRKVDATLKHDYVTGDILSQAEQELHQYFRKVRLDSFSTIIQNNRQDPSEIKRRLKTLNDEYDNKIKEVEESFSNLRKQMNDRHKQERTNFTEHWKDPKILLEYSKPSPYLLQLRELERRKALLNDFKGALEMKKQGDALEKKETTEAQKRAKKAMEIMGEQLIKQQLKEEEMLNENERKRMEDIQAKRSIIIQPLVNIIKRDKEVNSLTPKLRERERPSTSFSSCATARYRSYLVSREDDKEIATPRTFRRQVEYRNSSLVKQLSMEELDPDDFFKTKDREIERSRLSLTRTKTEVLDV